MGKLMVRESEAAMGRGVGYWRPHQCSMYLCSQFYKKAVHSDHEKV